MPTSSGAEDPAGMKVPSSAEHRGAAKEPPPCEPPAAEEGAADAGPDSGTEVDDVDQAAEARARLAEERDAAAAERDEYLEDLRRLKADFDNYRRRAQRELSESETRARTAVLAEFLPILDNLDRALNAAEHHEESKVIEGVRLTHNLFSDLLRKEGVEEVEALGAHFDPTVHEALITQPSAEHEEGVVTTVLERGYVCGDRVLRPAKVAVSSGPGG
jgi:molecular chaperone GrpE